MTATLEDVQEIVIDKWGTLNTTSSPQRLPEGHSPNNQNVWMDEKPGSVVTANGYEKLGEIPSGLPPTFMIDFFRTSDGSHSVVVSDGQNVYKTTNYVNFTTITTGLSQFFQLRGIVIRDKLWLTNGVDPVMTYDGTTLTTLDGSGGTPNVPMAKYIAYHDERVWLYGISGDPSSLRFSALTDTSGTEIAPDSANAWPTDNEIQISEGDADIGTGLFLYRGYLYAAKSFSVWRIVGYDEYTYTRIKTRSSTGTRFQESVQILDNLVHFIGVDGLYTFNGEESERISDIIDPASSEPGVFAFRNLQQPLLNNNFSNTSDTADWDLGTVPNNLSTDNDELTLIPADDTAAEFNAGTHDDTLSTSDGRLQLDTDPTGAQVGSIQSPGANAFLDQNGAAGIGLDSYMTNGNDSNAVGFLQSSGSYANMVWTVDMNRLSCVKVILKNLYATSLDITLCQVQYNTGTYQGPGESGGTWVSLGNLSITTTPTHYAVEFTAREILQIRLIVTGRNMQITMTEFEVYAAGYEADGKFISRTLDYTTAPASFGTLAAAITTNGETYQFFTQSSADGTSWDAEVNVSNGGAIGSTVRRYLRWGVYLYSSTGENSVNVNKVYVGGTYISPIIDTGGNINAWSIFQIAQNAAGQTINAYYRAASSSAGVTAQSWTALAPGAVPGAAVTDTFIQIRLELSTANASFAPSITSFTVNWVVGTGSGINTTQNVASIVILNRYWLSAATFGSEANDIIIVRGKATFGSPWHKKDFAMLSFARFQDYYIAGSSTDGSIYRLEFGYSKDGSAMDSFFETADFSKSGFMLHLYELLVSADRMGPYDLSVGVSTDGGISYTDKAIDLTREELTDPLSFTTKLNITFLTDSFRLRFRTNAADQPFSVDDTRVFYRLTPNRGSLN